MASPSNKNQPKPALEKTGRDLSLQDIEPESVQTAPTYKGYGAAAKNIRLPDQNATVVELESVIRAANGEEVAGLDKTICIQVLENAIDLRSSLLKKVV